jgi:hypothetical protein
LTQVQIKYGDSQFWKGLLKVSDDFVKRGTFRIKTAHKPYFEKIYGYTPQRTIS